MALYRGLLLDRDGVINVDRGYVGTRDKFTFMLGLFPFLRAVQDCGYRLAIVTNQSGVARGMYTVEDHEKLTRWMLDCLYQEGISVDLALACFEHTEGTIEKYRRESFWRKPNPGMILEVAQRLHLDLGRSAMLGDRERDMHAAQAAVVGTCLLLSDAKDRPTMTGVTVVPDLARALGVLTAG